MPPSDSLMDSQSSTLPLTAVEWLSNYIIWMHLTKTFVRLHASHYSVCGRSFNNARKGIFSFDFYYRYQFFLRFTKHYIIQHTLWQILVLSLKSSMGLVYCKTSTSITCGQNFYRYHLWLQDRAFIRLLLWTYYFSFAQTGILLEVIYEPW